MLETTRYLTRGKNPRLKKNQQIKMAGDGAGLLIGKIPGKRG
jgi:hypothetical protein